LKTPSYHGPKGILHSWKEKGFLGVTDEDIKSWNALRNPVAHGKLAFIEPDTAKLQVPFDRLKRIEVLITRIVLHAIGETEIARHDATANPYPIAPPIREPAEAGNSGSAEKDDPGTRSEAANLAPSGAEDPPQTTTPEATSERDVRDVMAGE
jgi:hypothetical protein